MNESEQRKEWTRYYRKNRFMTYYNAVMVKSKINRLLSSRFSKEKIDNESAQRYII